MRLPRFAFTLLLPTALLMTAPAGAEDIAQETMRLKASDTVVNADGSRETMSVSEVRTVYYDHDPSGDWGIQVGSFRAESHAEEARAQFRAQFPEFFSGLQLRIAEANIPNRGIFFRLIAGPFATEGEAAGTCERFKRWGHNCLAKPFPR